MLESHQNNKRTLWYIRFDALKYEWTFPQRLPKGLPGDLSYMNGYLGQCCVDRTKEKKLYYTLFLKFVRKISYKELIELIFNNQDVGYFVSTRSKELAHDFRNLITDDKFVLGPWQLGKVPSVHFDSSTIRYAQYTPIESAGHQNEVKLTFFENIDKLSTNAKNEKKLSEKDNNLDEILSVIEQRLSVHDQLIEALNNAINRMEQKNVNKFKKIDTNIEKIKATINYAYEKIYRVGAKK